MLAVQQASQSASVLQVLLQDPPLEPEDPDDELLPAPEEDEDDAPLDELAAPDDEPPVPPDELLPTPEAPEDEAAPLLEPPDEDDAPLDELAAPDEEPPVPPEELLATPEELEDEATPLLEATPDEEEAVPLEDELEMGQPSAGFVSIIILTFVQAHTGTLGLQLTGVS
jgi:type VI secretion system secreted protein VgrG